MPFKIGKKLNNKTTLEKYNRYYVQNPLAAGTFSKAAEAEGIDHSVGIHSFLFHFTQKRYKRAIVCLPLLFG